MWKAVDIFVILLNKKTLETEIHYINQTKKIFQIYENVLIVISFQTSNYRPPQNGK